MARGTGKDHARINLDIWGDDDWLDLTPAAQHLYFVLWTSPQLSYCGTGEWHPGRIAAKAKGWTPTAVELAGAELSHELFLLIDTDTSEFILRSWMKHDGLWRIPNMAVSMANARADLASRSLRAVIVHEVKKLVTANPDLSSWERDAVAHMLTQKSLDPTDIPSYNPVVIPTDNPWVNPTPNPAANGYTNGNGNPPANPDRTPAPAPPPLTPLQEGLRNRGTSPSTATHNPHHPPSPHCPKHPGGTDRPCPGCGDARRAREHWDIQHAEYQRERRRVARQVIDDCQVCDQNGMVLDAEDFGSRCPEHPSIAEMIDA
jgi:hypothetical protein